MTNLFILMYVNTATKKIKEKACLFFLFLYLEHYLEGTVTAELNFSVVIMYCICVKLSEGKSKV